MKNKIKKTVIFVLFFLVCFSAYLVRSYEFSKEAAKFPHFIPFTLESAMMYSYSWDIAKGTSLKNDTSLVGMGKYIPSEQMSFSLEYFLGYSYRLKHLLFGGKNDFDITNCAYGVNTNFVNWIRVQLRLWICLSSGFIFLWLLLLDCSLLYSFLGGLLFAVTPAAIARATGQDILRENFAILLIITSILSYYCYLKNPKTYKLGFLFLLTILALVSWDMMQLCLILWVIYEILLIFFSKEITSYFLSAWITIYTAAVVAGIINPYLYAHNFLQSPAIVLFLPLLIMLILIKNRTLKLKIPIAFGIFLILFFLWFIYLGHYGYEKNYSHFYTLIVDKIKFGNVKPINPLLLSFDSRMLWTPALHSATYKIYQTLFGITFIYYAVAIFIAFFIHFYRKHIIKEFHKVGLVLFLSILFFILFVFMVRFHSLAIVFMCIVIALLFSRISQLTNSRILKIIIAFLFIILIINEGQRAFLMSRDYYGGEIEQLALIKELNAANVKGKIILADFTLSPMLKAYCGAKIVLIPKFEIKSTRSKVESYLNILYHGNEQEFMEFCRKYDVEYFIFDTGMIGGRDKEQYLHPWSLRYIAKANTLNKNSPVYKFFYTSENLTFFYQLDDQTPSRFVIFKVITPADIKEAKKLYNESIASYKHGKIKEANAILKKALNLDPRSVEIRFLFYTINSGRWPKITL